MLLFNFLHFKFMKKLLDNYTCKSIHLIQILKIINETIFEVHKTQLMRILCNFHLSAQTKMLMDISLFFHEQYGGFLA